VEKGIAQTREGDWLVLDVSGEVDLSWSQQLRAAVLNGLASTSAMAVRLSKVAYIDSSGIAALVEGYQQARGKQQSFVLLSPSPSVRAVLELARLDRVFQIRETLA